MLKAEGFNPPDYVRRGFRLAFGLGIAAFLGFTVLNPESRAIDKSLSQVSKWAAITCVVVTAPLLGKVAQVSVERVLGTAAGGFLGYVTFELGQRLSHDESTAAIFLSFAAASVGFLSAWLGYLFNLDASARLFAITFLLVTFGADTGSEPLTLALTRIAGICCGVLLSLILSILVLPRSASQESVRCLQSSLTGLTKLTELVWATAPELYQAAAAATAKAGDATAVAIPDAPPSTAPKSLLTAALQHEAQQQQGLTEPLLEQAAVAGGGPAAPAGMVRGASGASFSESHAHWEADERHKAECETVLMKVYGDVAKMEEHLPLAEREISIQAPCTTRTFFLPGIKVLGLGGDYVQKDDLLEAAHSVRRVARILWAVHLTLEEGFDDNMREILAKQYPDYTMPRLVQYSQETVQSMLDAFPQGENITFDAIYNFCDTVEHLKTYSDSRRLRVQDFLKAFKAQRRPRQTATFRRRRGPVAPTPPLTPNAAAAAAASHAPYPQPADPNDPLADLWSASPPAMPTPFLHRLDDTPADPPAPLPPPALPSEDLPFGTFSPPRTTSLSQQSSLAEQPPADPPQPTSPTSHPTAPAPSLPTPPPTVPSSRPRHVPPDPTTLPPSRWARADSSNNAAGISPGTALLHQYRAQGLIPHSLPHSLPPTRPETENSQWAQYPSALSTVTQATTVDWTQGHESLLQRNLSLISDPLLFPNTIEGYISQVRWYSFQFLMDELADELLDLHTAIAHINL